MKRLINSASSDCKEMSCAHIAAVRPHSEEELLAIKGMGPKKLERYGAELLALVSEADN